MFILSGDKFLSSFLNTEDDPLKDVQSLRLLLTQSGQDRLSNEEFDDFLVNLESENRDTVDLNAIFALLSFPIKK